jgi:hypothetical protein
MKIYAPTKRKWDVIVADVIVGQVSTLTYRTATREALWFAKNRKFLLKPSKQSEESHARIST